MYAAVSKILSYYQILGDDNTDTIIVLHGWGDSSESFVPLAKKLVKNNNKKVILIDLPGFGRSQRPHEDTDGVWGLVEYANWLAEIIPKIQDDPINEITLVGHSFGGAVASWYASNNLPKRLLLLAASGVRPSKGLKQLRKQTVAKISGRLLKTLLPESSVQNIRTKYLSKLGSEQELLPEMKNIFRKIVAQDITDHVKTITCDTALLYGDQDLATPLWMGQMLQQSISGSRLIGLKGVGHYVHLDDQDSVIKAIIG
jgi:pimeloyl-ACP methyl ester carboxylesterase